MPAEMFGVAMISGGKLQNYYFAWMEDNEINFNMDKTQLPAGVSQIVLFNNRGETVCDRLIFTQKNDFLDIKVKTGKPAYSAYELVDLELSLADKDANPVYATFSLSVRDGANEVESRHTILTDLLLMSEIKGYVRNPSYYFEKDDDTHRAALDLLLMVQGWRRYSWELMAGIEPFELKYLPEQGIETHGTILQKPLIGKPKPKSKVDVNLFLSKREEDDEYIESFITNEQGRFAFISDIEGRWNMILVAKENGTTKNFQIVMDRFFSPEPRRYRYADLQVSIAENINENMDDEETINDYEEDFDSFLINYQDSLAKLGMDERVYNLSEVIVTANKRTREQDIYRNRSTSVAYYDVTSEMDDMYDSGNYFVGNNIHELLMNMNNDFQIRRIKVFNEGEEVNELLYYKNNMIVVVIDYEQTVWNKLGYFLYKNINLSAIKSIYINENHAAMAQYIQSSSPMMSAHEIAMSLSCAVFIETYPEGEIPVDAAKGVRKTWLDGYSTVKEFYNPDYSALPLEPDYRRTLYWNPSVTPDKNGTANITFYNNSSCTNFNISAETVTPLGMISVFSTGNF